MRVRDLYFLETPLTYCHSSLTSLIPYSAYSLYLVLRKVLAYPTFLYLLLIVVLTPLTFSSYSEIDKMCSDTESNASNATNERDTVPMLPNGMLDADYFNILKLANNINSTERNACESPLLRLPPEIRNRIWSYILSIRQITLKECPDDWRDDLDVDDYECEEEYEVAYYELKEICWASAAYPPGLETLLICRQTYAEASLLPFTLNTISFSKVDYDMGYAWFEDRLCPGQKDAVRKVELNCTENCTDLFNATPGLQLVRLRHVSNLCCGCKRIKDRIKKTHVKATVKLIRRTRKR
jgi:hypothetical protein